MQCFFSLVFLSFCSFSIKERYPQNLAQVRLVGLAYELGRLPCEAKSEDALFIRTADPSLSVGL